MCVANKHILNCYVSILDGERDTIIQLRIILLLITAESVNGIAKRPKTLFEYHCGYVLLLGSLLSNVFRRCRRIATLKALADVVVPRGLSDTTYNICVR